MARFEAPRAAFDPAPCLVSTFEHVLDERGARVCASRGARICCGRPNALLDTAWRALATILVRNPV
jgi:hypothetical protein